MKPHLMYRDGDFDMQRHLPWNADALMQDLGLSELSLAMSGGDEFLATVAKHGILLAAHEELKTVLYRQPILKDCLRNHSIVKEIYNLAVDVLEKKKQEWFVSFARHPSGILYGAVKLMNMLVEILGKLRSIADEHANDFESEGFRAFFALIQRELTDEYLSSVKAHLEELKIQEGILISAELGDGNQGVNYVLRKSTDEAPRWKKWMPGFKPSGHTFYVAHRDEAGARALSQLQDRGLNLVANALAQSVDHVVNFLVLLQTELAFYLGCVNLYRLFSQQAVPVCFPVPAAAGTPKLSCVDLRDASLVLSLKGSVVGNDLDGDGKTLCIITGANKGGKSVLLRSLGLAQLMMQCGMFVTAKSFHADVCRGLFTHYKREEDVTLKRGKFEEELHRMSEIVDALTPDAMLLFNESFAATNEREGSEVARQIVHALHSARTKIFYVTHLYDLARGLWEEKMNDAIFLRAERNAEGRRTFRVLPGKPLHTSFGMDLYEAIFASRSPAQRTHLHISAA
jgi:DNA mismatch repair ATPase MutS